jgi:hypothetical protein
MLPAVLLFAAAAAVGAQLDSTNDTSGNDTLGVPGGLSSGAY